MNFKLDPIRRFAFFFILFVAVAVVNQWSTTMLVHLASTLGFSLVLYVLYSWISSKRKNIWDTVITALIVFVLLQPGHSLSVQLYPLLAVFLAETIKFFVEWKNSPIVNPAAAGILLSAGIFAIFGLQPFVSWWGASFWSLPIGVPVSTFLLAVWVVGGFNVWKKWAIFFAFIISYLAIQFLVYQDVDLFKFTILHSTLYFIAAVMLPEPKTSPFMPWKQVIYGVLAAALMIGLQLAGAPYAELFGIIGANLFNLGLKWKPAPRVIPVN